MCFLWIKNEFYYKKNCYRFPTTILIFDYSISLQHHELDDKPGYVENDHLSSLAVTNKIKRPTCKHDGQPYRSRFGLASSGVYRACPVTSPAVSSYLAFPPLPVKLAVYFCCTSLGVASTRRYLAPCPMKPGLSSPATFRYLQPRSFIQLTVNILA